MPIEIAWAVVPTFVRQDIFDHGLLPRVEEGEDELYLFDTRERADRFALGSVEFFVETPDGTVDTWEAQVGDLAIRVIPNEDGPSALVKGTVPPERLRLVHTIA